MPILNFSASTVNPLAVQTLLTAFAILCLGVFSLVRERGSVISVVFFLLTLFAGIWLFAFSWMYSAADEQAAFRWAKAAHGGVALVPAAVYHFTVMAQQRYQRSKRRVWIVWICSALFLAAILKADILFEALYRYWWGFYPRYRWSSIAFLAYFFLVMIEVLNSWWDEYRRSERGTKQRLRARSFLTAFGVAYLASFDYAAAFGIPLYPFGYIPIFVFLVLSARAIWRYRFVDITPAFAAPEILNTMTDALLVLDTEGTVRVVNRAASTLFGLTEAELFGKPVQAIIRCPLFSDQRESFLRVGMVRNYEVGYFADPGTIRTLSLSASAMQDQKGAPVAIVCVLRDITERKRAEEELRNERDKAQKYFDVAGVLLVVIDAVQRVTRINTAGCALLGYEEREIIGKKWFDHFVPEKIRSEVKSIFEKLMAGNIEPGEYFENPVVTRNGEERIIAWHNSVLRDKRGTIIGTLSSGVDITERRRAEEQIRILAYYDGLTGLPNRSFYRELLVRAITHAERHKEKMAVVFIDLDFFKRINDTLGHSVGDQLLRVAAERLTKCVRRSDTVARSWEDEGTDVVSRLGGDEFIVVLSELAHNQDAARVANRILAELSRPFTLSGHEVIVSASIGIALYPADGKDAESLLKNADVAMYHAKNQGRNAYQFYTHSMNESAMERLTLENELRKALERDEFQLYYQPKLNLKNRKIVGLEALLRWKHPERGLVSPGKFIPVAEEAGLIVPIGEWVIRAACSQNRAWQKAGHKPVGIAVNLSGRQFEHRQLIETVTRALQDADLDPRYLALEITESAIMKNPEKASTMLQQLKTMGIPISIDDFGTGYSSLSYLKRFPVDELKIDRSFIMNIAANTDDAAIAGAIIAMAHSLKLNVVAEGVETEEQLAFLKSLGCDEAQGFLFGKPMPAEECVPLISRASSCS